MDDMLYGSGSGGGDNVQSGASNHNALAALFVRTKLKATLFDDLKCILLHSIILLGM